jgi:hypothetical protein
VQSGQRQFRGDQQPVPDGLLGSQQRGLGLIDFVCRALPFCRHGQDSFAWRTAISALAAPSRCSAGPRRRARSPWPAQPPAVGAGVGHPRTHPFPRNLAFKLRENGQQATRGWAGGVVRPSTSVSEPAPTAHAVLGSPGGRENQAQLLSAGIPRLSVAIWKILHEDLHTWNRAWPPRRTRLNAVCGGSTMNCARSAILESLKPL